MRKIILLFVLLFSLMANAQERNRQDLVALAEAVQKLPSYKDQVKTNPRLRFDLEKDFGISGKETDFELFLKLYQLIAPIRDNHLALYTNRDSVVAKPKRMVISKPTIDSLLQLKAKDSVLGTYYAGQYRLQILKFDGDFIGVIENGGVYYTQFLLKPTTPDHFDMIGFAKNGGVYYLNRNVVYSNGRLTGTPYQKFKGSSYLSPPKNTPRYEYRVLEDGIPYLRLGSFSTETKNIAESARFFEGVKLPEATAHLIVDLRDNGGGGYKTSKKFLDLIKRFNGKVHLLINANTVSNAEQFTIDLVGMANVVTYGETTRGTICYGNNMDTVVDLPSKRFTLYVTDMPARSKDIPYESYGIVPQVKLDPFKKDWIAQVTDIIKEK